MVGATPVAAVMQCCLAGAVWHEDDVQSNRGDCYHINPCEVSAARLLLSEQARQEAGLTFPYPPRGHDGGEVMHWSITWLMLGEGVVANPSLGVRLACLS
jgi:hypothetical protein